MDKKITINLPSLALLLILAIFAGVIITGNSIDKKPKDIKKDIPVLDTNQGINIKFTNKTYDGSFGGGASADNICNEEFPGYRFCTAEVLNKAGGSLPDPIRYVNPFVGGWTDSGSNSCSNWTSNSKEEKGSRLYVFGSTVSRWWFYQPAGKSCSEQLPVCCYLIDQQQNL